MLSTFKISHNVSAKVFSGAQEILKFLKAAKIQKIPVGKERRSQGGSHVQGHAQVPLFASKYERQTRQRRKGFNRTSVPLRRHSC